MSGGHVPIVHDAVSRLGGRVRRRRHLHRRERDVSAGWVRAADDRVPRGGERLRRRRDLHGVERELSDRQVASPTPRRATTASTCTIDDTCIGGACSGDSMTCGDGEVQSSCGEACDDGNTTSGDGCSATCESEFVCEPAPQAGCKRPIAPGASKIQLRDKDPDTGDAVGWKWTKGATTTFAELGAPLTTTDYLLCIYDGGRGLVSSARAPAAQLCAGQSCWSGNLTGFKYK